MQRSQEFFHFSVDTDSVHAELPLNEKSDEGAQSYRGAEMRKITNFLPLTSIISVHQQYPNDCAWNCFMAVSPSM